MMNQRIHQSPSWNPPTQQKSSQLASPSLTVQAQPNSPKSSQEDKEKEAFGQDRYEADRLQLKEKIGTLTSAEQEQLGVLQAKMNDFWVQRRERASQFGHNLANIPVSSPDKQGSTLQPKSAIQAKLTIGEPGDKYEQEADSVAAEVVNRINSPQVQQQDQAVQRMEETEEEELQAKPEIAALQRMEEPEEEELQTKPSISDLQKSPSLPEIQREAMPEEEKEDLQAKSILHRKEAIGEASADLESAIHSARGGGQALDAGLQGSMGQAMGADFSGVKVHTDAQSDQLNQSIQARAFTTGQDVFFRQGEYNPGSRGGQELIAHELTHVVQQNSGAVLRSKAIEKNTRPSGYEVIQRIGETEAAEYTATGQIRRGNRRGSLEETNSESFVKVQFIREQRPNIGNAMIEDLLRKQNKPETLELANKIQQVINNVPFFQAILAKLFSAGNCGEFAAITYQYIRENTSDQAVYIANMVSNDNEVQFDHAFTITYPLLVESAAKMNPEEAVVVDAWNNYKVQTLQQFYKGDNPYNTQVNASNISIVEGSKATNQKVVDLNNDQEQYILDATKHVYEKFKEDYDQRLENVKNNKSAVSGIFDFGRNGRVVDDTRNSTPVNDTSRPMDID